MYDDEEVELFYYSELEERVKQRQVRKVHTPSLDEYDGRLHYDIPDDGWLSGNLDNED